MPPTAIISIWSRAASSRSAAEEAGSGRHVIQPSGFDAQADRFGGVAGAEFAHHLHAVDFHGARADVEFAGDGLVAAAFGQPIEHFAFAQRQARDPLARFGGAGALGAEGISLTRGAGDRSEERRVGKECRL